MTGWIIRQRPRHYLWRYATNNGGVTAMSLQARAAVERVFGELLTNVDGVLIKPDCGQSRLDRAEETNNENVAPMTAAINICPMLARA
jgi:hypothetical protein